MTARNQTCFYRDKQLIMLACLAKFSIHMGTVTSFLPAAVGVPNNEKEHPRHRSAGGATRGPFGRGRVDCSSLPGAGLRDRLAVREAATC
jgi:hypothetical protein